VLELHTSRAMLATARSFCHKYSPGDDHTTPRGLYAIGFAMHVSVNHTLETILTWLLHAYGCNVAARQASSKLSTGVAWGQTSRDDAPARHRLRYACCAACIPDSEAIPRSSSRNVYPKATPVDNADNCLPTPQTAHDCSEHVCIVFKVRLTYLQNSECGQPPRT